MNEEWLPIQDFEIYAVSNFGRVINTRTELVKIPTANQQGIPSVCLVHETIQFRRSVALLVAHAFLGVHPQEKFTTPINKDGDRFNNHVDNLEWRPRWFASKYHQQFRHPVSFGFTGPVIDMHTGIQYDNVRECAKIFGLLEKEIIMSAHTRMPVFPTWQEFQLVTE